MENDHNFLIRAPIEVCKVSTRSSFKDEEIGGIFRAFGLHLDRKKTESQLQSLLALPALHSSIRSASSPAFIDSSRVASWMKVESPTRSRLAMALVVGPPRGVVSIKKQDRFVFISNRDVSILKIIHYFIEILQLLKKNLLFQEMIGI